MLVAALAGFFLDSRLGGQRRHVVVDRLGAAGRDVQGWSGKKVRDLRDKTSGDAAEIESAVDMQTQP